MPRIIPFQKCLARPGELLIEHVVAVKQSIEHYLSDFDPAVIRLCGLAGICHDLGKAHADWQAYIQAPEERKGPNHSSCGAFLFSYTGYHLLESIGSWEEKQIIWLWLIHDIRNHHGQLGDLYQQDWIKKYEWNQFDLEGIEQFLKEQYTELKDITLKEEHFIQWIDECYDLTEMVLDELDLEFESWEPLAVMKYLQKWRQLTTSIIAGDRFHVKEVNPSDLKNEDYDRFYASLAAFGKENAHKPLHVIRLKAQKNIMNQLEKAPDARFYTLEMPTGYGKTITSLKMAAWFGTRQGMKKIIYVAPYLSILEQTASVIENLFKQKVLEHHSLALIDDDPEQRTGFSQLAMESWAHSIICTSFQQFCKALFPKRAQDVLRRSFLKDSVVIIDEPQIFNPNVWNVFLCGLEALAELVNLKVIFLSATMPPFHYGLSKEPKKLSVQGAEQPDRYHIHIEHEIQSEDTIADFLCKNERPSQALILNTIKDAYFSFRRLMERGKEGYLIHGFMTPIHKKEVIDKIHNFLKQNKSRPLYVVSTQVLEAGIDLSFHHVARAASILPSVVQSAGRTNRHLENNEKGLVTVFPFFRGGETDTRSMVYPKALQKITDEILNKKQTFMENEVIGLIESYYERMFRHNTYEAALEKIKDAYEGRWPQLSAVDPFDVRYTTLPIFIPYEPEEDVDGRVILLKERFGLSDPYQIYERYSENRFMKQLSFEERKMFMILFHYYVLNVPVKTALTIVSKEDYLQKRIPILLDTEAYDGTYGLKAGMEEDDLIW